MSLSKPNRFWRAGLLGVINALIYCGVLFVAEKVSGYEGWPRVRWAWLSTAVLLIVCFSLAGYLVHRIWSSRMSSVVLLWLGVGIVAVCAWNVLWLSVAYWEKYTTNFTVVYREVTALNNPQFGLFSLALVVGTNLVFAGALKLASRQYSNVPLS
jgi:ABC-type iron transport system FetAB permease component